MSRKKAADIGHNGPPLTEEEQSALALFYELKILEAQRALDALMVDVKSARQVVNGHFKRLNADLQITRQDFEREVIATANMTESEIIAREKKRTRLLRLTNRRPGEQLDLLDDALPDTADEAAMAYANGYRVGHVAGDPAPPKELQSAFHGDWMRGYHDAQAENAKKLGLAKEVLDRLDQANGKLTANLDEDGEEEGEADEELTEAAVAAGVKKLKKAGFLEPTAEEQTFAETAA